MPVFYSPLALQDLEQAKNYISEVLLNPQAANEIVAEVFAAGDLLAERPQIGSPFKANLDALQYYRYLTVRGYLMIYRVQGETIRIVRILHHLRDIQSILISDR